VGGQRGQADLTAERSLGEESPPAELRLMTINASRRICVRQYRSSALKHLQAAIDAVEIGVTFDNLYIDNLDTRRPRLAEAQRSEVAKWVEDGPDLKTDGVVRWRCADLRDRIAALNFSSMSGRPLHPQSDLDAQQAFKKRMARPVCK
jgi:ribosome recycling factor